ncbi:NAD-dependent DNA ligase LigA [Anaerovorax odorimutans]|uniref:DNA ligase n=1 Tax=Anaerovorax odorimutans TaxID=109327 RepID=A0ABT1RK00_9FIRM|nr:NAD-dependent DNA ligase LigA [Anaerovorax odorimutans]MCQ4635494.1 NAD-dependent DNA ligase LigA [Anaerovorax odorimutans]
MEDKRQEIQEKVDLLNQASRAYYQESREIMSNLEYDKLYDELVRLEKETGIVLAQSPTVNVGYQVLSDLPKERHPSPMLSLDKTKEVTELADWLGDQKGVLSWKIDGLTIVLTYRDGKLYKAVTRGNGEVGEVITSNARVFKNIPVNIPFQGELILRGEACIKYSDFEKINETIEDVSARYKNPRNLCSGSVRQLNNEITAQRNVHFFAFTLVSAEGMDQTSREEQFVWLTRQGFEVVEYKVVTQENLSRQVEWFASHVEKNDVPSDGLVLILDDIAYGASLGATSKFPRDSIAFKWRDEIKETTLKEIEWSASRTGLINPVAIFEPVELEGTTVSRASVHNVSILKELHLGLGDKIEVYKANMIIPQIADNLTKSDNLTIPDACPVCGEEAVIKKEKDVEVLYCTNPECLAKQIKSLTHFVSRNAMNIDGLSEATLEKLVSRGYIKELADLFRLERYREEITSMEGFGEKSFENLMKALETARNTTPARLLYSLGIPNIGVANAKVIARAFKNKWEQIQNATEEALDAIDGIGEIMAAGYVAYFQEEKHREIVRDLLKELVLDESFEETADQVFSGKTFVITGSLEHYENRDALKAVIEAKGGKAAGSVSKKTDYLINNDSQSASSKNKKAKELGIPIITEEQFLKLLEEADN